MTVDTLLIIGAIVCFVIAAFVEHRVATPWMRIGWLGLALWALSLLI